MVLELEVTPEEYEWICAQNETRLSCTGFLEFYGAHITVNDFEWKIYQVTKLRNKLKDKLKNVLKDHYGTTSTTLTIQKIEQWLVNQSIINKSLEE